MPVVRLTAFFKDDDGNGWSETHDKDGGSSITALTPYLTAFDGLMRTFRRPLLAGDAFYLGCRASYRTASGAIAGDNIELDPPLKGPQSFSGQALVMTKASTAVKTRLRNAASTARSDVYMRGIWASIISAGVLDFGSITGAEWKTRADAYMAALIANTYGWQGTDPTTTSRGTVSGYTVGAGGIVTFTVAPTNGVVLPAVGTKMTVKFARINDSDSILNRAIVCLVASPTSFTSVKNISAGTFASAGTYVATRTGFIPYAAQSYYKLSGRKTGRPFGVGRGRLPAITLH